MSSGKRPVYRRNYKRKISTTIKSSNLVEERRDQIFQAASKLISKKGYHKTTLRDISKETGMTLGSLYDYIRTKEDILYIVHEKAAQMVRIMNEGVENVKDPNPVRKLKKMIEQELETMDRYQDLIMCIYQESHALSKPSLKAMLSSEEVHTASFKKVIEEGIEQGVFKTSNPTILANIIKMMIDCWVLKRWALRGKASLEEMKQGILEMVQTGIVIKDRA